MPKDFVIELYDVDDEDVDAIVLGLESQGINYNVIEGPLP